MAESSALDWINGIDTSIFAIDSIGTVTVWNRATESLVGYSSEEMVHQSLSSLECECFGARENLSNGNQNLSHKMLACVDGAAEHLVILNTKAGVPIQLKIKTAVQRDPGGGFTGLVCFAEEAAPVANGKHPPCSPRLKLHQGRELPLSLDAYADDASALLFGLDVAGTVNLWNDKSVEVTGYSKEEALGSCLLDMLGHSHSHSHADDFVGQAFRNAMESIGESKCKIELSTKCGEIRQLMLSSSERLDAEGKRVGTLFVAQDVTEIASYDRSTQTMLYVMLYELWQLIDKANSPMFGVDCEGDVNEWNDKMVETTGYSKEGAFDQHFVQTFVLPSLRQSVQEIVDSGLQGYGTSGYELEFRTIDGDIRYLLVNASPRRDIEGSIVGVLCIAEDVTEQAQHDRAIAAMARELRQLVDTANAPIFGIDVDGMVNEWNDKTAEITGFTGDEAFNRPLVETFIVPKLRNSVQEVLDNALEGRGTSNYELEFRTKSNEIRYLLVNATTRRDAENNIVGVVGVAQDVTEAAKHDRAVAAMANELRQLIDTANAPIFGIDVDGDVNEWNDKTAEITGFMKEEAFDCNLVQTFIVPSLRGSVQEVMDNALEGRGTSNYELEFRTKSNEIRHLLVNATTRRDAENNVVGVVGVAQDVTEAVHRDRAVAGMANELRQLIDTANAPIFGIDSDGNVNEWNNKTAEITGYLKEEAFDEPLVAKFIAPAMRKQVQEVMHKALTGNATSNYELEIISKSKEVRVLLVNATTRRDPDTNIVGGKFVSILTLWLRLGTALTYHPFSCWSCTGRDRGQETLTGASRDAILASFSGGQGGN